MKRLVLLFAIFIQVISTDAQVISITSGSIDFRSDAPLELIKAGTEELKGKIDISKKQFAFTVKITSFKGFNSPLQKEHFNENYMESKIYPDATFAGKIIEDLNLETDGTFSIRAKGKLTVHGVTRERIIKSDVIIKNKKLSLTSFFTVLLDDHNIPIPKVVHEKLASEIKVEVKASFD